MSWRESILTTCTLLLLAAAAPGVHGQAPTEAEATEMPAADDALPAETGAEKAAEAMRRFVNEPWTGCWSGA
jgi:hypothetical protein